MSASYLSTLLNFYGAFLILCGIISVIFIGPKAKTALMSGGTSGANSLFIAYLIANGTDGAWIASIILSLSLFAVFAWRSTKTLFKIFELLPTSNDPHELKGKGIAFLIISLMAMVSMIVLILQVVGLEFVRRTTTGEFYCSSSLPSISPLSIFLSSSISGIASV